MTGVLEAVGVTVRYPRTRRRRFSAAPGSRTRGSHTRDGNTPEGPALDGPAPDGTALDAVTLRVAAGETVGVVGRSGSGKSTLLTALLALRHVDEGRIALGGREVRPGSIHTLRWYRRRVQYVPQDPAASLDPRMTVEQLVREPLRRLDVPGDHGALVRTALSDVGLATALVRRMPRELSGGQAQRVAIARALATNPDFLLADEPISGLDLPMRNHVIELLGALAHDRRLGLVFVSHDLDAVARLCHRSIVLFRGRVVDEGETRVLLASPSHAATQELVRSIPRLPGGIAR